MDTVYPGRGPRGTAVRPIGHLRTPFATRAACPRNGRAGEPPACMAEILPPFVAGLAGLEGFSHLILLYWLHEIGDDVPMRFTPPFDDTERGLFATRSPARPNPIGLSVVAFEGFAAPDRLRLRWLDCIDGTSLLDIKPYLPRTDAVPEASMGWLAQLHGG